MPPDLLLDRPLAKELALTVYRFTASEFHSAAPLPVKGKQCKISISRTHLQVCNPTNAIDYQQVRKPWDHIGTKSVMTVNVTETLFSSKTDRKFVFACWIRDSS
jgi:hypothetical protein